MSEDLATRDNSLRAARILEELKYWVIVERGVTGVFTDTVRE
jgi:hypothetical protein